MNFKTSQLTEATTLTDDDLFMVIDVEDNDTMSGGGGTNKKIKASTIIDYISNNVSIEGLSDFIVPITITVDSASDALSIKQSGAGDSITIKDTNNVDVFVVNASGNLIQTSFSDTPTAANSIAFRRARGTTTPAAVDSGDRLASVISRGHDGTGYKDATYIFSAVDGTVSTGVMPSRITFSTRSSVVDASPAEHMRITSAGNIGIGTTNPTSKLHIQGGTTNDTTPDFKITGSTGYIDFHNSLGPGDSAYNPIAVTGDKAIIFTDGDKATGNFIIAPWSDTISGLRINSSGNVTIGAKNSIAKFTVVDSSANPAVRITQTGAGNALLVEDSNNPDNTPFVINGDGNVVVGKTAPQTTALSGTPIFQVHSPTSNNIGLYSWDSSATVPSSIRLFKSQSGTVGTQGIVADGTDVGSIDFLADDGGDFVTCAKILGEVDGLVGMQANDTNLVAPNSYRIVTAGTINWTEIGAADNNPGTVFQKNSTAVTGIGGVAIRTNNSDMPGRLSFYTTTDGSGTASERMRIKGNGRVGIGETTPTAQLQVKQTTNIPVLKLEQTATSPTASIIELVGAATSTTATGGSATALPEQPLGYLQITIGTTPVKIPYYSV